MEFPIFFLFYIFTVILQYTNCYHYKSFYVDFLSSHINMRPWCKGEAPHVKDKRAKQRLSILAYNKQQNKAEVYHPNDERGMLSVECFRSSFI